MSSSCSFSKYGEKSEIHSGNKAPVVTQSSEEASESFSPTKGDSISTSITASARIGGLAESEKIIRGENRQLIFSIPQDYARTPRAGQKFPHSPFVIHEKGALGPLSVSEHTTSAIDVKYDPEVIQQFLESDAEIFSLPLTAEKSADVVVQRVISRDRGTYSFLGKVADDPLSDVLLVFHDGAVSGSVADYKTNTHYEFGVSGDGDIAIRHLDPSSYDATCGTCASDAPSQPPRRGSRNPRRARS